MTLETLELFGEMYMTLSLSPSFSSSSSSSWG